VSTWRDHILSEFAAHVSPLTIVADPDELLLDEGIQEVIRERGFELLAYEEPVSFRYAYELKHRARWDQGEYSDLIVLFPGDAEELENLPADLLEGGWKLAFSLQAIFPNLSYTVIGELDRAHLDRVYEAQELHAPSRLGDNTTKDFLLLHVFGLAAQLLQKPSDLLRVLIRRHYRSVIVPSVLDDWFVGVLRNSGRFDEWPLETIVPNREAFLAFLQERWPRFVDQESRRADPESRDAAVLHAPVVPGPLDLPYEHEDIRVYVDNLFLEGLLHPIEHRSASKLRGTWASIGIRVSESKVRAEKLKKQLANVSELLSGDDDRYDVWLHLARAWAEMLVAQYEGSDALSPEAQELRAEVDRRFAAWLPRRYAGLAGLPPAPPVMVHHIPRCLARARTESKQGKVALIVVDGMSYAQWVIIRDCLRNKARELRYRESAVFAWIPTMTSISRQAIFSGKPPYHFPETLLSTDHDEKQWIRFWQNENLSSTQIGYLRGLGNAGMERVEDAIDSPGVQVIGLVVNTVDSIMHGMQLGAAGMASQTKMWAGKPFMLNLLDSLLIQGFRVFLTSDHGNIETKGVGRPGEGSIAELRGERVRIFSDSGLRSRVREQFPESVEWPSDGLPDGCLPLLAPPGGAFVTPSAKTVCHGGGSIEEVIVPFTEVYRGQP
jgi:hypothetical protein